ncbi:MAG: DUF2075 domain-containing protein [Myxococcales bacterium]|nr:MAG: DUF2075 domain-containing protein [Myxococcales bacterium]
MGYETFYKLTALPFSSAPSSRFYFSALPHERTLAKLKRAAQDMLGLAVCTGEAGSGKTMLARQLLSALPDTEYEAALLVIVHSGVTAEWLLKRIALQLGVEKPAEEKLALLSQLYRRLAIIYKEGRKAVVMIDEAQMLASRALMEEFRGLLNLEVPGRKLVTFVFFGLPDLWDALALDAPLKQRVAVHCPLGTLTAAETRDYIRHRLSLCGGSPDLFSPEAVEAAHRWSGGLPRLINTLCDNALYDGAQLQRPAIDAPLIDAVAEDLQFAPPTLATAAAEPPPAAPAEALLEELADFDRLLDELNRY